jgi:hypothetical protein
MITLPRSERKAQHADTGTADESQNLNEPGRQSRKILPVPQMLTMAANLSCICHFFLPAIVRWEQSIGALITANAPCVRMGSRYRIPPPGRPCLCSLTGKFQQYITGSSWDGSIQTLPPAIVGDGYERGVSVDSRRTN